MKNWILRTAIVLMTTVAFGNEVPPPGIGEAPAYVEKNGTAISMMGWGISIAVGIVTLVCLIPNHNTTTK